MHGIEIWLIITDCKIKVDRTETVYFNGCVVWFYVERRNRSPEISELFGQEVTGLVIKKDRLRWFGHFERNEDADWVKCCMKMKVRHVVFRGGLNGTMLGHLLRGSTV